MNKSAIVYFTERSSRPDASDEEILYNRRATLALEKQMPKLVAHERTFFHYAHYCPECTLALPREGLRYCDNCGQALDWSNYWEALKRVK